MIRFVISSHAHLPGVRLSRLGSYGNLPHPDEATARAAAERCAGGAPHLVTLAAHPALPAFGKAIARGL